MRTFPLLLVIVDQLFGELDSSCKSGRDSIHANVNLHLWCCFFFNQIMAASLPLQFTSSSSSSSSPPSSRHTECCAAQDSQLRHPAARARSVPAPGNDDFHFIFSLSLPPPLSVSLSLCLCLCLSPSLSKLVLEHSLGDPEKVTSPFLYSNCLL